MSAHEEEVTGELEADTTEDNQENSVRFSPKLVVENVKASLEPLYARISEHSEMMFRLFQSYARPV